MVDIYMSVIGQRIILQNCPVKIIDGSKNFINFVFDLSEEWRGLSITCQFSTEDITRHVILDDANSAILPQEIAGCTEFEICLQGNSSGTIATSETIRFRMLKNRFGENKGIKEITPSLFSQIMSKFNTLSARFDTYEALKDGSTTGDAELQDLRIANSGVVYGTAGEAVRKQLLEIYDKDYTTHDELKIGMTPLLNAGILKPGHIKTTDGNEYNNHIRGLITADYMMPGAYIDINTSIVGVVQYTYDSTGKYFQKIDTPTFPVVVPDDKKVKYLFYQKQRGYTEDITAEEAWSLSEYIKILYGQSDILATNDKIKRIDSEFENIGNLLNEKAQRDEFTTGYCWEYDNTSWLKTGRILLDTGGGSGTIYGLITQGWISGGSDVHINLLSDMVGCIRFVYTQDNVYKTYAIMSDSDFPFTIPDSEWNYRFAFYDKSKGYGTVLSADEAWELSKYIRISYAKSQILATNGKIMELDEKTENTLASADFEEIFGVKMFTGWIRNKEINLNGDSCDINLPEDTADYSYILIPCNEGEIYTITGKGGTGARLYGCIAGDGKTIIEVAPARINREAYELEIPSGAEWLVVNANNSEKRLVYKGKIAMKASQNAVIPENGMHLVAHRGLDDNAHEGTIRAFEDACRTGMYAVNTAQIRKSADGTLWIFHDSDVSISTNGTGLFGELSDSYIASLRYNGIGAYDDNRIPKLEEVVAMCHKYGVVPMLRFASGDSGAIDISDTTSWSKIYQMLERYNFKNIMFSGSLEQLAMLDKKYPNSWKCYYVGDVTMDVMISSLNTVQWGNNCTVFAMMNKSYCNMVEVEKLRSNGYGLYIATTGNVLDGLANLGATFAHVNQYANVFAEYMSENRSYVPTPQENAYVIRELYMRLSNQ